MKHTQDNHFKTFAGQLEKAIEKYGGVDEIVLVERQKKQVESLVALERKFRKTLIKHPWGPGVYRSFIHMITEENGNILAARPYFRERQDVFTAKISKALRDKKEKRLYPFAINYQFVRFVMESRNWKGARIGGKVVKLADQIALLRTELVEMNMPLAISRARIFWSRTPKSHLSYMDLVQISCEGLMSAVDKFVLPYSKVFRSVAIGRIVGNFISNYSETLVHFYPQDKRKIYRANKGISKLAPERGENIDYDKLADEVNKDVEDHQRTNSHELSNLVAAASHVSTDVPSPDQTNLGATGVTASIDRYAADDSCQPDNQFEAAQLRAVARNAYGQLNVVERKLLRLKGVELGAILNRALVVPQGETHGI
jgi:RNA polymerase sigma factor (sigma-70 family)